jgi:very-long-chain (3R)-3-hydroxyacyl-CoA dehydratase
LQLFVAAGSPILRYYLVAYNVFSTIGWGFVLAASVAHLAGRTELSKVASVTSTPTARSFLLKTLSKIPFLKSALPLSSQLESVLPPALIPILDRAKTIFSAVGWKTAIVQSFAILEVVHSLFGWVRSPVTTTAMQVASRLILVWGIADRYESVSHIYCFVHYSNVY